MSQEQNKDMSQYFYRASAADFMKIPGSPVAYWASANLVDSFSKLPLLKSIANPHQGMATTNNDLFLRRWYEVSQSLCKVNSLSLLEAKNSPARWFPIDKGGEYRKWYGNNEFMVNFQYGGKDLCEYIDKNSNVGASGRVINREKYFLPGVTWSAISSSFFSVRYTGHGHTFSNAGMKVFHENAQSLKSVCALLNSKVTVEIVKCLSQTLNFDQGIIARIPTTLPPEASLLAEQAIGLAEHDWDEREDSWNFKISPLILNHVPENLITTSYKNLRENWLNTTHKLVGIEQENNFLFVEAYGLQDELMPEVPLAEITLTCNPHYRYGGNRSEEELETLLQCDTLKELVSYAIGCMMGRYSLDKPGLILASQGETLQDYLRQIPAPRFTPDDDAILPLTDQEWFTDDATNRFREFIREVWGEEHLQQNLDFVAESLCLHAIKLKKGESSLDTIRRYLSTQFFKDHLRTYKKRPIYWLFSSGKHKAFECLVYLHRYNEGTLARMRTEYVIPLTAKLANYAAKLEKDLEASTSTAEKKRLEKELTTLHNQQAELAAFDEKLRHYADQRISLDLDDGVKLNYGKFGDLLAEVKAVTGGASE